MEFISAMAAGWNSQLVVETWSQGGRITTSVGLAVARSHTCGRHVCVVSNERVRSKYVERIGKVGVMMDIMVGEYKFKFQGFMWQSLGAKGS